jgi:integrase/recombinase XerD
MDHVSTFLESVSAKQTRRAYRTDLLRFFQSDEVGEAQVTYVRASDVQSFVRTMHREEDSLATQRRRLAALRSFFDWLIEEDVVRHNPARDPSVKPLAPEATSSSARTVSKKALETLIATAGDAPQSGPRDRALILTIVYAALRRSEVAHIEVDDVRPLGRYWILDLQPEDDGGSYVRIPKVVLESIEEVKDVYDITSGRLWRSLSPRNRGEPMSPDAIYKVVRRVSKEAGLDPVSIDTLRRSGLHLALQGGADLPQVQAHGRLQNAGSAARLHEADDRPGALGESAVECIDLDISDR